MSIKAVKGKHEEMREYEVPIEDHFDLRGAVISFSKLTEYSTSDYIYTGQEKIPFKKRHLEYQSILINEFAYSTGRFDRFTGKGKFSISF